MTFFTSDTMNLLITSKEMKYISQHKKYLTPSHFKIPMHEFAPNKKTTNIPSSLLSMFQSSEAARAYTDD